MRYLVTGGLGRRGIKKVKELIDNGHVVLLLDDMSGAESGSRMLELSSDVQFIRGSVTDRELLSALVSDVDRVCHYAKSKNNDPFIVHDVNNTGTFNVCQYVKQYDKGNVEV